MKRGFNKNGSGHLEMMLSFVFFLGFVFMLFLFLKPYDTQSMLDSLNRGLANSFEQNTSVRLTSFFLEANYTNPSPPPPFSIPPGQECFNINLSKEISLSGTEFSKSLVKNISENKKNSTLSPNGILEIKRGSAIGLTKDYFNILISPEFQDEITTTACLNHELTNYKIGGSFINKKVLSYNSLVNLNTSYLNNYESVKTGLGIPKVYDFAITSKDIPEINMDVSRGAAISSEVFARNYYFLVVNPDGDLINAEFNIKVW